MSKKNEIRQKCRKLGEPKCRKTGKKPSKILKIRLKC